MCSCGLGRGHVPQGDNIGAIVELIIETIGGHFDFDRPGNTCRWTCFLACFFAKSGNIVGISDQKKKMGLSFSCPYPFDLLYKYLILLMVPELGIEPRCPCERGILSPLRLPVSPLRHGRDYIGGG